MSSALGSGYLAQVEANLVGVRAAPGAVFLRLSRNFASENQQTSMFTEMTPGQALSVIRELEAAVKQALVRATEGAGTS